jgi:nucleoside-diphosphate-sugar epimerase
MRARSALVTGSAGFIGRHVVTELIRRGYTVTGVDVTIGTPPLVARDVLGDALHLFRTEGWRYDLIVHAAAVVGGRTMIDGRPFELAGVDLELDAALWRYAHRTRPGRVLYLSSSAAYPVVYQAEHLRRPLSEDLIDLDRSARFLGRPDGTYGLVKLVGELLAVEARAEGIPVTVVRPFSGYGEDQAVDYPFPAFVARALRREDPFEVWGPGTQVRDFVHVDDVVRIAVDLAELGVNDAVNIGTGRPTSFLELAELVTDAAGYRPAIVTRPDAPVGVDYRVADTDRAYRYGAVAELRLEDGVARAIRAAAT